MRPFFASALQKASEVAIAVIIGFSAVSIIFFGW